MDSILGIRTKYLLILRVTGGFRYSMNEIILAALNVLENQKSMEPVLLDRLQLKIRLMLENNYAGSRCLVCSLSTRRSAHQKSTFTICRSTQAARPHF
jgi:hypothetical protein